MQKTFINRLHLVLHAYVQIFDVRFFGVKIWDLNTPKMVAINYICTPIKCNHCTLGEENQRYSSLVSYVDIKNLTQKYVYNNLYASSRSLVGPGLPGPHVSGFGWEQLLCCQFLLEAKLPRRPVLSSFFTLPLIRPLTNGGFSPASSRRTPPHRLFLGLPVTI